MKTSTLFLKNILCFVISILAFSLSAQTIITVDNSPLANAQYSDLQDAIDAAPDNAIIYVQPSPTAYGNGTIEKPLTIIGRSHSEASKKSSVSSLNIYNSDVTIKGLDITNNLYIRDNVTGGLEADYVRNVRVYECYIRNAYVGYSNSQYGADDVLIQGCVIYNLVQYWYSLNIVATHNIITYQLQSYTPNNMLFTKNIFNGQNVIRIWNYGSETIDIEDNMFVFNGQDVSILLWGNNTNDYNVNYCLTYNYGEGDVTFNLINTTATINNTLENTNPLFTNVDPAVQHSFAGTFGYIVGTRLQDDITLQAGSPALTAGTGGTELGVYADGFNFKMEGSPRGVPVTDILTAGGSVPANGIFNVEISAKAN